MKTKKSKPLPKTVYVQVHGDTEGDYLAGEVQLEALDEDVELVGVYQLVEVKKCKVERKLV